MDIKYYKWIGSLACDYELHWTRLLALLSTYAGIDGDEWSFSDNDIDWLAL
jgi:hypothetical protein